MKNLIKLSLLSTLLAAPVHAQVAGNKMDTANCPAQMVDMQKSMGVLLRDNDGMMKMMKDPVQLARMQKMHDQMAGMMDMMQKMNGGMMGGGMMGDGMRAKTATPPAASDDHAAHHPDK
jgi:hypothetical protein